MEYKNLINYLKDNNITEDDALLYIRKSLPPKRHWKMMRFTFFVWERVKEDENGYLKPKIDTCRAIVRQPRFRAFFEGYFPDLELNEEKEIKLLNKLIAEKPQRGLFTEGFYIYEGSRSKRLIPQKHLDYIFWGNK